MNKTINMRFYFVKLKIHKNIKVSKKGGRLDKRHLLDKEGKQLTNYTKVVQAIRIRSIAKVTFSKTKSISSSVVSLPREKRIKEEASFSDLPRAERT